jgi:hypothetical protein
LPVSLLEMQVCRFGRDLYALSAAADDEPAAPGDDLHIAPGRQVTQGWRQERRKKINIFKIVCIHSPRTHATAKTAKTVKQPSQQCRCLCQAVVGQVSADRPVTQVSASGTLAACQCDSVTQLTRHWRSSPPGTFPRAPPPARALP